MYVSNKHTVNHLLDIGYDEIWLKAHGRRHDLVRCQGVWYRALDLWNLFDGIAIDEGGTITFLQIKTNAWASKAPILKWLKKVKGIKVLVINVKYKERTHKVLLREYKCTDMEVSEK